MLVNATTILVPQPPTQTAPTPISINGIPFTTPTTTTTTYVTENITIYYGPNYGSGYVYYYYDSWYYFFFVLIPLLMLIVIFTRLAARRREIERQAAVIRMRARRQAEMNAVTVAQLNSTGNNNGTVTDVTLTVPKDPDLPPTYDDVVQAYLNVKEQLQAQTASSTGNTTVIATETPSAAVSTITIATDLGDDSVAGAGTTVTTTTTTTTTRPPVAGAVAPPPAYDITIINNDSIV